MPRKNTKTQDGPRKATQTAVKARKVIPLGQRDPDTMRGESHAENARGTRKWRSMRKAVMSPGGLFNVKSTGYGN